MSEDRSQAFVAGGGESGALIRAFDWSTTCLGPLADWPQSLKTSVSTMLRSPYPIILFWGRDRTMLYNDPFRPILGEKHPGTVGASARQALAEAWELLGPLMAEAIAKGEPIYVQNAAVLFARRPGGLKEEAYFTWSYNPTIGEDGEVVGLFAIASETTRQVVGDRRLATLRELSLRTAVEKSVESVFRCVTEVLDPAGADVPFALLYVAEGETARLVACSGVERGSPAAPQTLALDAPSPWPLADVARTGEERVLDGLDRTLGVLPGGPWPEHATRALVQRVPLGADTEATGVLVTGLGPLLSLDDEYRSFLQLLARQISTSLSSARAYEQELQRVEKLAELNRAKTDFFNNVSHELRTPLTLILGPLEDALARPDQVLTVERLDLVRRNALRLYKMVNTLLDFSRIEAGRVQATFVPVDLAALTSGLASHFHSAAEKAGLDLVVQCAPLPEPVFVDPEMWEKIVLNLLSNAVKYTHHGRIEVGTHADGEQAVVTVHDTGTGIAADELAHVFERFYRARVTEGRSHEGTGIGLSLVRELVELHGGSIEAESALGLGTTFTVRLRRGSSHLPADRIGPAARPFESTAASYVEETMRWSDSAASDVAHAAPPAGAADLMPPQLLASRILLADDSADLRSYVAGLLGVVFQNVETVKNGQEALERARASPPDLILSDVMMPVMDGFALVRALRADPATRSIPIILLSARAGDEPTVEGLDSGADDYLVKPFSARELMARVRSQLEMSRFRAEIWSKRAEAAQLRAAAAMREEFIAVSSHELRTPLAALQLQLDSLQTLAERNALDPSGRLAAKLTSALRQVDRLSRLVETLLDVSHVARGPLHLTREAFDLAELVQEVVTRFEGDGRASGTTFHVDAAPAPGHWDRARLDQVLGGLLSNAVKYAAGTRVEVSVRPDADAVTVAVRDAGIGIPEEALARVFEPFERAESIDSYGGFGIGLYLARRIVEAHGGTIAAERAPRSGTLITVRLPRRET